VRTLGHQDSLVRSINFSMDGQLLAVAADEVCLQIVCASLVPVLTLGTRGNR
jgi:hypothetical protein